MHKAGRARQSFAGKGHTIAEDEVETGNRRIVEGLKASAASGGCNAELCRHISPRM